MIRAVLVMLLMLLAACGAPPAAIIGVDGVAPPVADVAGASPVDVFVATSRAEADDPKILFSGERSRALSFARVTVFVPPDRPVGEISRARTLPPDPRREFVVLDPRRYGNGSEFVGAVDAAVADGAGGTRPVLVFVHGFNTDLASAIVLTAQFVHDSGFAGVPVLFSWPSRGQALSYVYDVNSVLASRDALVETAALLKRTRAKSFDVLGHSLGNLLVVEALRQMALTGELAGARRLGHVMLASPDIDIDVLGAQLEAVPTERVPLYVMVASTDRALALSRRIAGGVSRAGNADPQRLAELGVTVLDVSSVRERDFLQHSQFASVPAVVQLIGRYMGRTGALAEGDGATAGGGLQEALVQVSLVPARIIGAGRVFVAVDGK